MNKKYIFAHKDHEKLTQYLLSSNLIFIFYLMCNVILNFKTCHCSNLQNYLFIFYKTFGDLT